MFRILVILGCLCQSGFSTQPPDENQVNKFLATPSKINDLWARSPKYRELTHKFAEYRNLDDEHKKNFEFYKGATILTFFPSVTSSLYSMGFIYEGYKRRFLQDARFRFISFTVACIAIPSCYISNKKSEMNEDLLKKNKLLLESCDRHIKEHIHEEILRERMGNILNPEKTE